MFRLPGFGSSASQPTSQAAAPPPAVDPVKPKPKVRRVFGKDGGAAGSGAGAGPGSLANSNGVNTGNSSGAPTGQLGA